MPAQNASPSPVMSTARTVGSARKLADRVDDAVAHRDGERVLGFGPVEHDAADAVGVALDAQIASAVMRRQFRLVRMLTTDDARAAAAGVVLQRVAVARLDLALAGFAAQLPPALGDLRDAGRADRVALGEQAAATCSPGCGRSAPSRPRG